MSKKIVIINNDESVIMVIRNALKPLGYEVEAKTKIDLFSNDFMSYSIKEFLEGKLNSFLDKMTKIENCNLHETIISEVEKALFSIVMRETNGNKMKAAKVLGINRNTLNKKLKGYKLI